MFNSYLYTYETTFIIAAFATGFVLAFCFNKEEH